MTEASEVGSAIQHHLSSVNDSFPVLRRSEIRYFTQDAHTQDAVIATYPAVDDFKRGDRKNERSEMQPSKLQSHRLSESMLLQQLHCESVSY